MKKAFCALVIPLLLIAGNAYSQSNKGTEFWTGFMAHNNGVGGARGSNMVLYITSDVSTTGTVTIGGSILQNFTVTANQVTFIDIPTAAYLNGFGKFPNSGIHITSVKPIAVYAHIYANNVSGATLLLPVNAMGKEYVSLNYTQIANALPGTTPYSTFAIIGIEDNTSVSITPSAQLLDGSPANVPFTITLNKGEIYQGLALTDLTGTKIQSISTSAGTCKKIAVFSGSSRIAIGCTVGNSSSSDNLFQQVYPTSTWGKNYVTAPLASRPFDVYRVVLSIPNTNVTLNGAVVPQANFVNGLYFEFTSTQTNIISADKPIQVVQYSPTQGQALNCTTTGGDTGDPEMIYLSPIEQGLNHVTLYSAGYYAISQSYINVVIPTSAASSFTLDGLPYTNFRAIPNSNYSYAQIAVTSGPQASSGGSITSGTHTINASVAFNAIAYGFGNFESYGYAAGTNLQDLNEYVVLKDPKNPTTTQTTGCSNITYNLQVTIPFQTTNISWKIDGVTTFTDTNPVVKSTTVKDNIMLYTYEYNAPINFTAATHIVVATVFNPVADVCGSNQDIENGFTITEPPGPDFDVAASNCLGDLTVFTDKTILASGNTVKNWLWDFGDNTTSTDQNPVHKYAAGGNYNIRLTVTDYNGCINVSNAKTVHITSRPVAGFNVSNPDCPGQTITFNNTSTTAEGVINKWTWDFGDSTTVSFTNGAPVTHTFTTAGTYNVKLTVNTDKGCVSDAFTKALIVNPLPVVDFVVPDVCLADGAAPFIDNSTIADHTEAGFTYLWDFGDPQSTAANNRSTLKNPKHTYSAVGIYNVKLTVTSQNGCTNTLQKSFTVNGSTPKADFRVENNCSGEDIVFDDLSTVDAYNITKIVWYFDYNGNPGISETYTRTDMHADKKYTHHYTLFNTPAQKTYNVRMDVYSGQTCVNTVYKAISVNANPVIGLLINNTPITNNGNVPADISLCYEGGATQVVEDKSIYAGTGIFTGPGISSTGLFNPKTAGTGTFTINYGFTAGIAGCTYSTSFKITVNPTPVVSLPAQYTVLEGNQVTIRAVAALEGGNFTYQWSPSAGLSSNKIASPVVTASEDTKYTITVTSDKGCAVSAQTMVHVLKVPVIPNAFTPNNDGINDTWDIKYLNAYPNAVVEIFNRYGNRVFLSYGYTSPWDGRFNGADLPVGTYYYIISPNSGRKPVTGYLTIIR
ncbi:PKD domain-containing protein [Mucilaginibacter sp. UYCu711]|uniref:PKD domain-containing protein n=1 Tax=Mucilaginibacter sp. UYCu711 TaxID=3156339 RepID=UPI003D1DCD7F